MTHFCKFPGGCRYKARGAYCEAHEGIMRERSRAAVEAALAVDLPPVMVRDPDGPPKRAEPESSATIRQRILMAAAEHADEEHKITTHDLAYHAWREWPAVFGLRGHERESADSNKVIAKLSGKSSPVERGWMKRVDVNTYLVTREGQRMASLLRAAETTK